MPISHGPRVRVKNHLGRRRLVCICGAVFQFSVIKLDDGVYIECENCGAEHTIGDVLNAVQK